MSLWCQASGLKLIFRFDFLNQRSDLLLGFH